jgi:hypothetical protein
MIRSFVYPLEDCKCSSIRLSPCTLPILDSNGMMHFYVNNLLEVVAEDRGIGGSVPSIDSYSDFGMTVAGVGSRL